jgi:hypothetical protein
MTRTDDLTYEDYYCMMMAHGCEHIALSPKEWEQTK